MRETSSLAAPPSGPVCRVVLALIERAESYAALGCVAEARSAFHAAVVADDTPGSRLSFAAFLVAHGDWETAYQHLRAALDIAHTRGLNHERHDCSLALSQLELQRGNDALAHVWLQRAVKWELLDTGATSAAALLQCALLSIRRRCVAQASSYLQRALSVAADDERAEIILHIGIIHRLQGDYVAALSRMAEADQLFESQRDLEGCAYALINAGHIQHDLGRHNEANRSFDQAKQIFTDLSQSLRAQRAASFACEARRTQRLQSEAYQSN